MAGSLRAGWGLQQSVDLVVEQMAPPVSDEFKRAQTEIRLGRPVEDALETVAVRTQSDDFMWAVTAIGIQRDVGGNLAEVLDVVAATIRDRMALRRQISALTAEGRLSAWVLLILPFVLVTVALLREPALPVPPGKHRSRNRDAADRHPPAHRRRSVAAPHRRDRGVR